MARANLARKVGDPIFRHDLDPLVIAWPDGYLIDGAADLVDAQLLDRLDD